MIMPTLMILTAAEQSTLSTEISDKITKILNGEKTGLSEVYDDVIPFIVANKELVTGKLNYIIAAYLNMQSELKAGLIEMDEDNPEWMEKFSVSGSLASDKF